MPAHPTDHAGLEMLPLDECLRLLASVPVGRVGLHADGEVVVLPVNHVVDGQDVIFRTAPGSKLSAAEAQSLVVFEADHYDPESRTGWSVLVNGHAEVVYEDAEISLLDSLGLQPWADAVDRPFWVRIRPTSVTGRLIPGSSASMADVPAARSAESTSSVNGTAEFGVFNVLRREASHIRSTPFGEVGTVFSGRGMELAWVSKHGEPVDENWFSSHEVDVMLVIQGQLKLEFDSPSHPDCVLGVGEVLVLPAGTRCRAYRWPRDAGQPTIFVAAYPASRQVPATSPAS